jgi:hypothetical protein
MRIFILRYCFVYMNRREWAQSVLAAFGLAVATQQSVQASPQLLCRPPRLQPKKDSPQIGHYLIQADVAVPPKVSHWLLDIGFPTETLVSLAMGCQGDLLVAVNGCWFPDKKLYFSRSNDLVLWCNDYQESCPFSRDVKSLYLTNTSRDPVRLRIYVLYD